MTVRIRLYFAVIYFTKALYSFRNITVDNHGSFFRKCPEIAPVSVTVDLCHVCGPTLFWRQNDAGAVFKTAGKQG